MTATLLPEAREAPSLVPDPSSICWRRAGDARVLLTAGYALVLQVAHPVVGAGVREHSNFREDPWGRLVRTLDYVHTSVYGGAQASAGIGRRVREMHKRIKGVDPAGRRYHSLDPEAYAWVHATLAQGIVLGHAHFGRPFTHEQRERFYSEWRALGRLVGVRERDLPDGWDAFSAYVEEKMATRLEDNDVVHDVLAQLMRPAAPPLPLLPAGAWRAARVPAARVMALATVGLLPPVLRTRFGLRWTARQERELRALGAVSRAATPLMPPSLRVLGPTYLRWRREPIARMLAA